jgi:hypothetical protein
MAKLINLLGQRFGRLVVVERMRQNKRDRPAWRCLCDCGVETIIEGENLRYGHTKSCGCLIPNFIDLTGQRFGKLVVLEMADRNKFHHILWKCKCDCGMLKSVSTTVLRNGKTISCGCAHKEAMVALSKQYREAHGCISETYEYKIWQSAKHRAKRDNLPFNILPSDIIIPKLCPVLGIELKRNGREAKGDSPSMDKIIPQRGYVKGNIRIISFRANSIKRDATAEELRKVADDAAKQEAMLFHQ